MMDEETKRQFAQLWRDGVKLEQIASVLGYSFASLAKWRMMLGLPKRYGNYNDDGEIPEPAVIRLRCLQQQTNWTTTERRLRWRGPPHTIYDSYGTADG